MRVIARHLAPRLFLFLAALTCVGPALQGCDDDETPEVTEDPAVPPVGVMEIPVSHRTEETAPAAAVRIAISQSAIVVDSETVVEMERGRLDASHLDGATITPLATVLRGRSSAPAVALRVELHVPFKTLTQVLNTAHGAGLHTAFFEVRKRSGTGIDTGYIEARRFRIGPPSEDPIAFTGDQQRTWDEFANVWPEVQDGCRREDYVDCEGRAINVAEGGNVEIRAWSRDNALRIEFDRFGGPEPTTGGGGPELLPGVPAPAPAEEEGPPPDTHATFTWRFRAATAELSAISDAMRPLCGARPCGMVVTADPETPSMRLISLLGAAYPNGTPRPDLYFVIPE